MISRLLTTALLVSPFVFATSVDAAEERAAEELAAEDRAAEEKGKQYSRPALIRFEAVITTQSQKYLMRKLKSAKSAGADLVIIEIDSPGGGLYETQELAEHIRDIEWAHTVAYIPKMALSGGAMLALACDDIVMGTTGRMGDVGVVIMQEDYLRYADEKVSSDLVEWARIMAKVKGRPPALVDAMIIKDQEVIEVTHTDTGEIKYITAAEREEYESDDQWEVGHLVPESQKGRFLVVDGNRATELGLADDTAESREELKQIYDLKSDFIVYKRTWVDGVVSVLNWWLVTFLLIVVGLVAFYIEFSAPGISVGGLIGGLCFALFFWSKFLGGTSGLLEVILFVAGITFILVEIFVIPGFGISGIAGLLLLLVSVIMAGQNVWQPRTGTELNALTTSITVVLGAGVSFVVVAMVVSRYMGSLPLFGRLVLKPEPAVAAGDADSKSGKGTSPPAAHIKVKVGDWGQAETPLRPAGKVIIGDDYVDVVTDGSYVESGTRVRVIEISGNRIVVREAENVVGGDEPA